MHHDIVSASVSVYRNNATPEGQETVKIPSRLTLSLHIKYFLVAYVIAVAPIVWVSRS